MDFKIFRFVSQYLYILVAHTHTLIRHIALTHTRRLALFLLHNVVGRLWGGFSWFFFGSITSLALPFPFFYSRREGAQLQLQL